MKVLTEMVKRRSGEVHGAQKKLVEMTLEQMETMGKAEHKKTEPKEGRNLCGPTSRRRV